jgi:hypothetical protein
MLILSCFLVKKQNIMCKTTFFSGKKHFLSCCAMPTFAAVAEISQV